MIGTHLVAPSGHLRVPCLRRTLDTSSCTAWSFSQHSHRSLTGLLFQVSDVFTIMLGSRSSSCSHGGLMPLLLLLITGCAFNGAKRYRQPLRRPLCLSFITTRREFHPHSVKREVVAHVEDTILLHHRLPRTCLQMPDVTLATAENNFVPGLQQGTHRQQILGY